MSGTFGYELDLNKLTAKERVQVKRQIKRYRADAPLITGGDYYRLTDPAKADFWHAWEFAAPDGSEALLDLVVVHPQANPRPLHLTWKGLVPEGVYRLARFELQGERSGRAEPAAKAAKGQCFTGAQLMYAGLTLPQLYGDYPSAQLLVKRVK